MIKEWSKSDVEYLIQNYHLLTSEECAEVLGRTRKSIKEKAYKIGLKSSNVKKKYREIEFKQLVSSSKSLADLSKKIGKNASGTSYEILRKYIDLYQIDTSHFNTKEIDIKQIFKEFELNDDEFVLLYKKCKSIYKLMESLDYNKNDRNQWERIVNKLRNLNAYAPIRANDLSIVLVKNSPYVLTSLVRQRLINQGIIKYECLCGNKGEWMGKKITLQLDHINGDNKDHRKENLRFLCPNCHSQTRTYGSKNQKK